MSKELQEIVDPVSFLRILRQRYWRGQSNDEMYDQLSKLIVAKVYAEINEKTLTTANAALLWQEAHQSFMLAPIGTIIKYADDRLDRAIDYLSRWRVDGNNQLWHVMHHAWLDSQMRRGNGQYYTPWFIRRFMVSVCQPQPCMRICDPCGGSGGFLLEAANHLKVVDPSLFYYFDIDGGHTYRCAQMILSLYKHGSGIRLARANMEVRDSLVGPWPTLMDRIYTNVPFGMRVNRRCNGYSILDSYKTGKSKSSELSQILFIEQCLKHLTPRGQLATVVDKGVVTNKTLRHDRAILSREIGQHRLRLVVELPKIAFSYSAGTSFPTFLLFFTDSASHTSYAKVENPGYGATGYVVAGAEQAGFSAEHSEDAWDNSDWPRIINDFNGDLLPNVDITDVNNGDWHYGAHIHKSYTGQRLADIIDFIEEPWRGSNDRNPTVDRDYRILVDTHLCPLRKVKTLRNGCLFMSRLLSNGYTIAAAVIFDDFDGAGCTAENYVLCPRHSNDLIRLWYLINFDHNTQQYLYMNARGQGRGRIMKADLERMPVPIVADDVLKKANILLHKLKDKSERDLCLKATISGWMTDATICRDTNQDRQ